MIKSKWKFKHANHTKFTLFCANLDFFIGSLISVETFVVETWLL